MTRFARAKGSKAANERAPEDGTPWEVLKEQLSKAKHLAEDAKKSKEAEKQRIENYEKFLKEQKVQKRKATWCDFPESAKSQINAVDTEVKPLAKKKKKNKNDMQEDISSIEKVENASEKTNELNVSNTHEDKSNKSKKKNKHKKKSNISVQGDSKQTKEQEKSVLLSNKTQTLKVKKNNNKQNKVNNNGFENMLNSDNYTSETQDNGNSMKRNPIKNTNKDVKKQKFQNAQPTRRKAIDDNTFQLIINGKEVELVRYDGFPIMKNDAERLQELKMSMLKKGIPKSEVQRTMKLERRRAEKALARLKRDVCYNCRKGGHNLSDCPDLKSKIPGVERADGMCFKCGSTEHRQFECKVQRDKEFRFATCFICREPGHIARQCPDNPKGLYPNGGCCKLCGDVTHLRKDCPTAKDKKEETSVKLDTLESADNVESIGQKHSTISDDNVRKPKKIKF